MNNLVSSSDFAPFLNPLPNNDMNMRTTFIPPVVMVTKNLPKLTASSENAAVEFLTEKLNSSDLHLKGKSNLGTANILTFEHLKNGLPIINHEAKITTKDNEILAYSYNFEGDYTLPDCPKKKSSADMQEYVESRFKSTVVPGSAATVLVDIGDNRVVEALKMQLATDGNPNYEVAVDNCNLDIVYFVNYTAS